ncbi:DOMON domain-containing protein [Jimgerdemannia flammicorona]|uniref:DOMON domain-containing protein n=1 Tax=Jimgerdemannia flammicorona TaxID=994334 RepID=A0A433QLX6_9FUNG|nr:DOMON domain-containing protein [Jimgerdemannia flammicorona]
MKTPKFLFTSLLSLVACVVTTNAITIQTTTAVSPTLNIDLTSYPGTASLLTNAYTLYWRVDQAASVIYLALDVSTAGWVGFGIADPNGGGMRGSDIVTLSVSSNETHSVTSLTDRYAVQHGLPSEDTCNQWNVTGGWQSGNRTVVTFNRKLDTGDTQDRPIKAGLVKIIAAYSADGNKQVAYHGSNKHASSVTFFADNVTPITPKEEAVTVWNYTNPPTPIAAKETKYVCTENSTISLLQHKSSMVRIVLALHLFVYLHPWPIHNIPSVSSTAWAPGTEALTFPANVGLPFGNANDTFDSSSLVIEVHYNNDNPNVTPNLTDASGLSISYTTTKREHDAGLIAMGDPSVMGGFMPFGPSKVEKQFICPGECTAKWPWDINVFASFLHMHEYGRQIWTGVTSPSPAGGNLFVTSDLDRANFYEFTFQHISTLNRTVKRGDRLNLHCVLTAYISYSYDLSTNLFPQQRANDTGVTFNLASEDEMCMDFSKHFLIANIRFRHGFLYYYPRFPNPPQFSMCGLYVNQTSTCGEFNKDGIAGIPIQNPVSPGTANADPIITGVIAFGTDYSNGTCVFDAAHLALVPNGTVVYQIANTPNTTNTTNTTTTTTTTTKSSTNGAGSIAIMNWISAIVVATVVAMVTVV